MHTAIKALKLNIYKNQFWAICTYKGLRFEGKKIWGHLRIVFLTSGYRYPEVGNIFHISPNMKIFWDVDPGPRYYLFMKKSRARKSHDSVPLNKISPRKVKNPNPQIRIQSTNFLEFLYVSSLAISNHLVKECVARWQSYGFPSGP